MLRPSARALDSYSSVSRWCSCQPEMSEVAVAMTPKTRTMNEAFALKDRLVFMDIYVDPTEHVYPMQIADGSMRDMWLSKTERT